MTSSSSSFSSPSTSSPTTTSSFSSSSTNFSSFRVLYGKLFAGVLTEHRLYGFVTTASSV